MTLSCLYAAQMMVHNTDFIDQNFTTPMMIPLEMCDQDGQRFENCKRLDLTQDGTVIEGTTVIVVSLRLITEQMLQHHHSDYLWGCLYCFSPMSWCKMGKMARLKAKVCKVSQKMRCFILISHIDIPF